MSFFNLFKRTPAVEDAFFGKLRYVNLKESSKNYYAGSGYFSPDNSIISYFIKAGIKGPTEAQREFYIDFQINYPKYIQQFIPLIEDEFRNRNAHFRINNFKEEFKVVNITIPRVDAKVITWDITFETLHDPNHQITIDFIKFEPNTVLIDG